MKNIRNYFEIARAVQNSKFSIFINALTDHNNVRANDKFVLNESMDILFSSNSEILSSDFFSNKLIDYLHGLPPFYKDTLIISDGNLSYRYYIETFAAKERIIIFGAGHVSAMLCRFAALFNFEILVIDDRDDLLKDVTGISPKIKTLLSPFTDFSKKISINEKDYLVVITRGHSYDKEVLMGVLNSNYKYLGMIGSRKRVSAVKEYMIQQGFLAEKLNKMFAPIGIPIGGSDIEDIALSIMAQIIAVKNNVVNKL